MPHDKGLFHWVPDLNSDDEHDITDYLILDELNNATHREDDARGDRTSSLDIDEDDEDDEDILLKYGIDRNDYCTREDFLEAVQEAKTGQAENYKEGLKLKDSAPPSEYGEEPEDAWLHTRPNRNTLPRSRRANTNGVGMWIPPCCDNTLLLEGGSILNGAFERAGTVCRGPRGSEQGRQAAVCRCG